MNINKDLIKKIAQSYFFDVDDKNIIELEYDLKKTFASLEIIKKADVDHLKPTDYNPCCSFNTLRKDEPVTSDADAIIKNAKFKKERYVVVK